MTTEERAVEINRLQELKRKALNNAAKQRLAERAGKNPRVSSLFWGQAIRDYNNQINKLIEEGRIK